MLFHSVEFWLFLIPVIGIYYMVSPSVQWMVLLAASLIFYLYTGPGMLFYPLFTVLITYWSALRIGENNRRMKERIRDGGRDLSREEKQAIQARHRRISRIWLGVALTGNLGLLFVMKYASFFAENVNGLFTLLSLEGALPVFHFALPVGLSFYTFQALGYVIDVSRGLYEPQKNLGKYALFVLFFPQILQGPVGRYPQMEKELYALHRFGAGQVAEGLELAVWGLFKKLVIADQLGRAVDAYFGNYRAYPGIGAAFGGCAFVVQLYADFSGYMDIAEGVARMFGIRLFKNFRNPFFSWSIQEFWQRWHISLGEWFKDYVFYPLLKSRMWVSLGKTCRRIFGKKTGKEVTTYAGMFCLWFLIGAWHGADWKFILASGLIQWLYIVSGKALRPLSDRVTRCLRIREDAGGLRSIQQNVPVAHFVGFVCFQRVRVFLLFSFAMLFFRASSTKEALEVIRLLFSSPGWSSFAGLLYENFGALFCAFVGICVLVVVEVTQNRGISIRGRIGQLNSWQRFAFYTASLTAILIFGTYGITDPSQFIYFQF